MRTKRPRAIPLLGATLAACAAVATAGSDPWKKAARYEFEYRVHLATIAASAGHASLWVPYAVENLDQRVVDARVDSPWAWRLTREEKYGNRMIFAEGSADESAPDLVVHLTVERQPSTGIPAGVATVEETLRPACYGIPDKLVPFDQTIRDIAEQEAKGRKRPALRPRGRTSAVPRPPPARARS